MPRGRPRKKTDVRKTGNSLETKSKLKKDDDDDDFDDDNDELDGSLLDEGDVLDEDDEDLDDDDESDSDDGLPDLDTPKYPRAKECVDPKTLLSKEEIAFKKKHAGNTIDDLDAVMPDFEPLMRANPSNWFISLWRVHPEFDHRGIKCSGYMCYVRGEVVTADWIQKNHGGGTYTVKLHGATITKKGLKANNIIRTIQGIEVAGEVTPNKKARQYRHFSPHKDDPELAQTLKKDSTVESEGGEMNSKILEHYLESARRTEQKYEETIARLQEMSQNSGVSQINALKAEFSRALDELKVKPQESGEAKHLRDVIEGLRKDNEELRKAQREELTKLQNTYENRLNSLQVEHKEYRKDALMTQSELVRDARSQAEARLDQVKMMYESQLTNTTQNYETRIQLLESQLSELKSNYEAVRRDLDKARDETHKARLEGIQATLEASNSKGDGLDITSLQKTYESVAAISSAFGFQKNQEPKEGAFDKLLNVAGKVAASDKFAGLMGSLAQGPAMRQPAMPLPNPGAPPQQAISDWEAYKQMRSKERAESAETSLPEPKPESVAVQPNEVQHMVDQIRIKIEEAAISKLPIDQFILALTANGPVSESDLQLAVQAMSVEQMLEQVGLKTDDLTLGGYSYFEKVHTYLKQAA